MHTKALAGRGETCRWLSATAGASGDRVLASNSQRPTRRKSTVGLRRVGVRRCERDNYFECVETPADRRRFNSHRLPDVTQLDLRVGRCELVIDRSSNRVGRVAGRLMLTNVVNPI